MPRQPGRSDLQSGGAGQQQQGNDEGYVNASLLPGGYENYCRKRKQDGRGGDRKSALYKLQKQMGPAASA